MVHVYFDNIMHTNMQFNIIQLLACITVFFDGRGFA